MESGASCLHPVGDDLDNALEKRSLKVNLVFTLYIIVVAVQLCDSIGNEFKMLNESCYI